MFKGFKFCFFNIKTHVLQKLSCKPSAIAFIFSDRCYNFY